MATFRVQKESGNFVTLHKSFIHDSNLSFKAKGILVYLLSRPDDWQIYEKEILKHCVDGKDSLNTGLKELEKVGYIERNRKRDEKGHLKGYEYMVYEQPIQSGNSYLGLSGIGKPATTNNKRTNNDYNLEREQPENNQTIIQNYQQKIGIISPNQMEELYRWLDDFKEVNENEAESIINYAIDKSEEESAYSFSYLNNKLRKLATSKATTLERAKLLLNNKKNKNSKGKTDKSGNEYVDFDEMFKGMED